LRGLSANVSRIVDEPVDQAIGIEGESMSSQPWDAPQPLVEARADARGLYLLRKMRLQFLQQRRCGQVHARPVFLRIIADDGQTREMHMSLHDRVERGAWAVGRGAWDV